MLRNGCWLPGVMSDSPGYHTPGRLTLRGMRPRWAWLAGYATPGRFDETFGSMTPQGKIPRQDWLHAVWYPGELDSPGYFTPWSHVLANFLPTHLGMILRQVNKNPPNVTPQVMKPRRVMLLYCVFRKKLIVLFIVSFEPDEIET